MTCVCVTAMATVLYVHAGESYENQVIEVSDLVQTCKWRTQ